MIPDQGVGGYFARRVTVGDERLLVRGTEASRRPPQRRGALVSTRGRHVHIGTLPIVFPWPLRVVGHEASASAFAPPLVCDVAGAERLRGGTREARLRLFKTFFRVIGSRHDSLVRCPEVRVAVRDAMFQVQDGSLSEGRARVRPVQMRPTNVLGEERRAAEGTAVVEPSHQVVEIHVAPAIGLSQLARPVPLYRCDTVLEKFFFLGCRHRNCDSWRRGNVAGSTRASRA